MSNRILILATFFTTAAFGIAGLMWNGASSPTSAFAVPAPEAKTGLGMIEICEYGPDRISSGRIFRSYREQSGQQQAYYGVYMWGSEKWEGRTISLEDAEKLHAFFVKYKGRTKSNAKEINQAHVKFTTIDWKGNKFGVDFDLATQQFRRLDGTTDLNLKFLEDLEAAINDAKAMKKVPFSVTP